MKHIVRYISLVVILMITQPLAAQFDDAENFTITDLNGQSHSLYEYLDEGTSVLIYLMAPWCPPCINTFNSGILQGVYEHRGPTSGPEDIMILFIDTDTNTSDIELEMPIDFTSADFPVCNLGGPEYQEFYSNYGDYLSEWPHALAICPDRSMREISIESIAQVISWLIVPVVDAGPDFTATCYQPTIDASVSNADSSYITYSWIQLIPGFPDTVATNPPFPYNELNPEINAPGIYQLGARNLLNSCSTKDIVIVTGVNKVAPLLTIDQDTIEANCFGDTLEIETDCLYLPGLWDRFWSTNEGNIIEIPFEEAYRAYVKGGGIYTTTAVDQLNGCTSTLDIVVSEPLMISIDSIQVLNPTPGNNDGEITLYVSGGTGTISGAWNTGNTGLSISGLAAGSYNCTLEDQKGCMVYTDTITLALSTSSKEVEVATKTVVHTYPNPMADFLNIILPENTHADRIDFYTPTGQIIITHPIQNAHSGIISINTHAFPQGMSFGVVKAGSLVSAYFNCYKELASD